jgi:hypothetical protein
METLARWFTPLDAGAFAARPGGRACLVTFGDGWYDNHAYALPVLERTGVPMLLFVATSYIGSGSASGRRRSPPRRSARPARQRRRETGVRRTGARSWLPDGALRGARRWQPSHG